MEGSAQILDYSVESHYEILDHNGNQLHVLILNVTCRPMKTMNLNTMWQCCFLHVQKNHLRVVVFIYLLIVKPVKRLGSWSGLSSCRGGCLISFSWFGCNKINNMCSRRTTMRRQHKTEMVLQSCFFLYSLCSCDVVQWSVLRVIFLDENLKSRRDSICVLYQAVNMFISACKAGRFNMKVNEDWLTLRASL